MYTIKIQKNEDLWHKMAMSDVKSTRNMFKNTAGGTWPMVASRSQAIPL
jgi:hypothetical protein